MSEEKHEVRLISESGESINAVLAYDDDLEPCVLALRFTGKEITASEDDFFEALCAIRRQLESEGLQPHCYGASRNVFPSTMSRETGGGLKAYKLTLGNAAKMNDIVFIFDSGPDVEPVTVTEQEVYYNQWLKSLGL
jgi:hypothetical protein